MSNEADSNQPANPRNETLALEWAGLAARWAVCRPGGNLTDAIKLIDERIASNTGPDCKPANNWQMINETEQLVAKFLTLEQINVDFPVLLSLAQQRGMASTKVHEANAAQFPVDTAKLDWARSAYLALLHDLQSDHVHRRFSRRLNSQASHLLFRYGWGLAALFTGLFTFLLAEPVPSALNTQGYLLILAAAAGATGAYFSRAMRFLADLKTRVTSYEDFVTTYVNQVMRLRIVYGVIGATVFYFLLKSGVIAGSVFPKFDRMLAASQPQVQLNADTACLLVWSFLAGFSERLVPDSLTRVEGKATQS